ncbi:MAG TPA: hypothetical protein VLT45_06680 [Kofleriaceae bacterium]|nr:hypothetical protein [Kofleriaceae bacterium]
MSKLNAIARSLPLVLLVAACGGSKPNPMTKPPEPVIPDAGAVPVVDAAAPDAGLPAAVTTAPAFIFRYHTPQRSETWTLQTADGAALLVVETAQGTTRYEGTAQGDAIAVATKTAKLALSCKHTRRRLSRKCNDAKAPEVDVLDCYHPDFATPMPFGPAPGVEYVEDASCKGYRLASS